MIRATVVTDGEQPFALDIGGEGIVVYLDNCAIIELAKDKTGLRDRFLSAIEQGGDVLFSVANLVEVVGPQLDREVGEISAFLRAVGNRWMLAHLDPVEIVKAEARGLSGFDAFGERRLLYAFVGPRAAEYQSSGRIIDLGPEFFDFSVFHKWLLQNRSALGQQSADLDTALLETIVEARRLVDAGQPIPPPPVFHPERPATFALQALVRDLIIDRHATLGRGDSLDLYHAVIGAAFASAVVLDKRWVHRLGRIKGEHQLAKVFKVGKLAEFITTLEVNVKSYRTTRRIDVVR